MADHKRKKKRGRSKLFRSCFRSFAGDERPLLNDKPDGRSFKKGRLGKPVLVEANGRQENDFVTDSVNAGVTGNGVDCSPERSTHGRGVSRLLKAVLCDSVMAKKIRSNSKLSIASDTSEAFLSIEKTGKQSADVNACGEETTDMEDSYSRSTLLSSSSRATSTSYSSSSSSSINSNSRWPSELKTSSPVDFLDSNHTISSKLSSNLSSLQKSNLINHSSRSYSDQKSSSQTDSPNLIRQDTSMSLPLAKSTSLPASSSYNKQLSQSGTSDSIDSRNLVSSNPDNIKSGRNNWSIRWCLFLLLSLIVLVIYGRIYSILCTSVWFYLVPLGRVKRVDSVISAAELLDTESEQYKKRVIMAGLLDRTRNPLR